MSALARWCFKHRFAVITAWVGLLIALAVMSQAVKTSYDNSLTLPGTGSGSAEALLLRSAPAQAGDTDQIVWRVSRGSVKDPAIEQRMSAMLARVSRLPEVASVTSPYLPNGSAQVSAGGRTAYATVNFTKPSDTLDKADVNRVVAVATAAREPGLAVQLGGKAISGTRQAPLSSASAIGIGAAAVILLIAFGSLFAMTLPIVTAVAGFGPGFNGPLLVVAQAGSAADRAALGRLDRARCRARTGRRPGLAGGADRPIRLPGGGGNPGGGDHGAASPGNRRADQATAQHGHTALARVITAAAIIMIAVFTAFALMGQRDIAEFGIGLAVAVALDAFLLRTVLVPAMMHLCGAANWRLPRWLDRYLPQLAIEPPEQGRPARTPKSTLV